ncbi:glycoside hydrolase family 15 protein [Pedobacter sp. L105]|uniref:glycoside hydrolase family 15 protein n=1 Tax=Pedobacter sp. L105 TaxID=1641871 RepID=UPI00131AD659|nr:glycoside hydrolase family 15 protein [Pedobacter sp. L105]
MSGYPLIKDLAVISDRHTCALLDNNGRIYWYCPDRFDGEAILSSLLDAEKGGFWSVGPAEKTFLGRQFQDRSSILHTYFSMEGKGFTLTDFMPLGMEWKGICRKFSRVPYAVLNEVKLKPNYGLEEEEFIVESPNLIRLKRSGLWLCASHPLSVKGDLISFTIPKDEEGWASLTDSAEITRELLNDSMDITLKNWSKIESLVNYHGPFENQVRNSLRALQQMIYEPSGGIVAAATTSLPEVIGGERNYDYRFVWMRDAALITSSLTQIITTGELERKFISFIAGAMDKNNEDHVSCFYGIDQTKRLDAKEIPLSGYMDSQPVFVGNPAAKQFQLDAEANVLIACSLIYNKFGKRTNWETVSRIADYICKNWERKDNGIWEEEQQQHYTSSKAFAARGLELLAPYQEDKALAKRWLDNAALIREFINKNCKTTNGAYAIYAGSEEVDLSAALFVAFGFDQADSEPMLATIGQLEEKYCENNLYRRHLLEFDSTKEGAFLAGSCWMAHYYAIAGDLDKSKKIIEAVLGFSNDLGYFSEEVDIASGQMLGNFPQTFVHSSFICAVNGYKLALQGENSAV